MTAVEPAFASRQGARFLAAQGAASRGRVGLSSYSLVDEIMHWRRYLKAQSDVVEMWSHVFILIGHGTMMAGWWLWYAGGYTGVAETLTALAGRGGGT